MTEPDLPMPSRYDQIQDWAQRAGVGALYVFAALCYIWPAVGNSALAVMLLAFLVQLPGRGRVLWREPLFQLTVIFLAYLLVRTLFAVNEFPHLASAQWKAAGGWAVLWLFVVSGWFMNRKLTRVLILLSLLAAGFLVEALTDIGWDHLLRLYQQDWFRADAGMTANALGMLSAVGLFGMLCLVPLLRRFRPGHPGIRWAVYALPILGTTLFALLLLISISRTAWAAMLGILVLLVAATLLARARSPGLTKWRKASEATIVSIVVIGVLGGLYQLSFVHGRINRTITYETDFVSAVRDGKWDEIPRHGLGVRYHIYRYGIERTVEAPIFGWGPGTSVTAEFGDDLGEPFLRQFADLHNAPLVVWARLGLVGLVLVGAAATILIRRLLRDRQHTDTAHRRLVHFLLGTFAIVGITSLTNFRWIHVDFGFLWVLVAGVAYTLTRPAGSPD